MTNEIWKLFDAAMRFIRIPSVPSILCFEQSNFVADQTIWTSNVQSRNSNEHSWKFHR